MIRIEKKNIQILKWLSGLGRQILRVKKINETFNQKIQAKSNNSPMQTDEVSLYDYTFYYTNVKLISFSYMYKV